VSERQTKDKYFCPACGAELGGEMAAVCTVCGKLPREGYFPLDNLRASYRGNLQAVAAAREPLVLFEENKNKVSETAWAFAVYSAVPYLGIVFCPGAIVAGIFGILVAKRDPKIGGEKVSKISIAVGIFVMLFQIFLWWLLYVIPTLER
jgi:hypothetical protein